MTEYGELPKVSEVIDGHKFVINRGSNSDVRLGTKFLVFGLGNDVSDPDTGENLGALELVRGRAEVTHVQERMSTLESTLTESVPGTVRRITRGGGFSFFGDPREEEIEEGKEVRKVPIDVQVGDFARPI